MTDYETVLSNLRQINPTDGFEPFIADLWSRQGWQTKVTKNSRDRGVDVIAEKESPVYRREVIQAKLNSKSNKVGRPEIQQYNSLKNQEPKPDVVIIITTSSFTRDAKKAAKKLNVKLVSGRKLVDIIAETNSSDLMNKYVESAHKNLTKRQSRRSGSERLTQKLKDLKEKSNEYHSYDSNVVSICPQFPDEITTNFNTYNITDTTLLGPENMRLNIGESKNLHMFTETTWEEGLTVGTVAMKYDMDTLVDESGFMVIGEAGSEFADIEKTVIVTKEIISELCGISLDDVSFPIAEK